MRLIRLSLTSRTVYSPYSHSSCGNKLECEGVYTTKYLGCVDKAMPMLWSSKDDDRLVEEVRQGKAYGFV